MKRFIQVYLSTLIGLTIFMFCGGHLLFDFHRRFYLSLAMVALVATLIITSFISQAEKLENLEKRIQALEHGTADVTATE